MSRLYLPFSLVLLTLVVSCAPMRQPGALSPLGARVTNEVIADDAMTLASWTRRVAALRMANGPASGPRAYAAARAAAWLTYARDAYAWDPRDGAADAALAEVRALVVALEAGTLPAAGALPDGTDAQARADLWLRLGQARDSVTMSDAPATLADAEVALVRADRLVRPVPGDVTGLRPMTDYERACELQLQVATAERLLASLHRPAAPVITVALQGAPAVAESVAVSAPAAAIDASIGKRPLERAVHFAVNSSVLSRKSRITLDEVVAMLRTHPGVNLLIEGFTDPRGSERHNRDLAVRRADAVRRFLDNATHDLGRVTMEGIGTESSAVSHTSVQAFARDRRVRLAFTGRDGQPLTVGDYQALDVDHERDLQVERARPSRGAERTRRGSAQGGSGKRR